MKITLIVILLLFIAVVIYYFMLGVNSRSGQALGLIDGQLSKCPNTPNCVCSEEGNNGSHYIDPIVMSQRKVSDAANIITQVIHNMDGDVKIENDNYLAATFSSTIFGFVDDFEIRIDSNKNIIHIRSASRTGRSDLGVNKKRIELFKQLLDKSSIAANQ